MTGHTQFVSGASAIQQGLGRRCALLFEAPSEGDSGIDNEAWHLIFTALSDQVFDVETTQCQPFAESTDVICRLFGRKSAVARSRV